MTAELVFLSEPPENSDDFQAWQQALDAARGFPAGLTQHVEAHHRSCSTPVDKDSGHAFLAIPDRNSTTQFLPLGEIQSIPKKELENCLTDSDQHPLLMMKLLPVVQDPVEPYANELPEPGGWLYIFLDGHLWRELRLDDDGRWSDVDLAAGEAKPSGIGLPIRKVEPTGMADHTISIPVRIGDHEPEIELALSHRQWSLDRIKAMGGLGPKDYRRLAVESEHDSQDEEGADPAALREKRFHLLNPSTAVQTLSEGDISAGGRFERTALGRRPRHMASLKILEDDNSRTEQMESLCAEDVLAVELNDAFGQAERLRNEYDRCLLEQELIHESLESGEYALASLVKALITEPPDDGSESSSRFRQWLQGNESPTDRLRRHVVEGKVNQALDHWSTAEEKVREHMVETGNALVAYLSDDRDDAFGFMAGLSDFMDEPDSTPRAAGLAMMSGLLTDLIQADLDFQRGKDFIADLVNGNLPFSDFIMNPAEDVKDHLVAMEGGKWVTSGLSGIGHLTGMTSKEARERCGTPISDFAEAVTPQFLQEEDGLEKTIHFVDRFTITGAHVTMVPLIALTPLYKFEAQRSWIDTHVRDPALYRSQVQQIRYTAFDGRTRPLLDQPRASRLHEMGLTRVLVAFQVASAAWLVGRFLRSEEKIAPGALQQINAAAGAVLGVTQQLIAEPEFAREQVADKAVDDARKRGGSGQSRSRMAEYRKLELEKAKIRRRLPLARTIVGLNWISLAAGVVLTSWEVRRQLQANNPGAAVAGMALTVGGIATVTGGMMAVTGANLVGFAIAATPVGWLVLAAGLAIVGWGAMKGRDAARSRLELLLRYGWFGQDRYEDNWEVPEDLSASDAEEVVFGRLDEQFNATHDLVDLDSEMNLLRRELSGGRVEIERYRFQGPDTHRDCYIKIIYTPGVLVAEATRVEAEIGYRGSAGQSDNRSGEDDTSPWTFVPMSSGEVVVNPVYRDADAENPGVLEKLELWLRAPIARTAQLRARIRLDAFRQDDPHEVSARWDYGEDAMYYLFNGDVSATEIEQMRWRGQKEISQRLSLWKERVALEKHREEPLESV